MGSGEPVENKTGQSPILHVLILAGSLAQNRHIRSGSDNSSKEKPNGLGDKEGQNVRYFRDYST